MQRDRFILRAGLIAIACSAGCSFSHDPAAERGGTSGGTGSTGGGNFDGSLPDRPVVNADVGVDATCAMTNPQVQNLPPDVLILLDRSQSMTETVPGTGQSKWTQMTAAINSVVPTSDTTVRWGLKFFASTSTCGVNTMADVAPGSGNGAAITAAIGRTMPGSSTPTTLAETAAATYLMTVTDPNPKYILLATDGQPTCGGGGTMTADDANAIAAVQTVAGMGIPTFVIGIATAGNADATLNSMAEKGGTARVGQAQEYYPVANGADLAAALMAITSMVADCSFKVSPTPPDAAGVTVTGANSSSVPQDATNGWTLTPSGIQLHGTSCDDFKNKVLTDVVVHVPCIVT